MGQNGLTVDYENGEYIFRFNGKLFATVRQYEVDKAKLEAYTDMEYACMMVGTILLSKMMHCDNSFAVEQLLRFIINQ